MIPCAADGVVVGRGSHKDFGNTAIVKHNDTASTNDKYTLYAHMPNLDSTPANGSSVSKGQTIGTVGNTGRSTGPHLHFELISLPSGTWWTKDKPWKGGATGIKGSTGRIDPLSDANWGALKVHKGDAAVSGSPGGGEAVAGLCFVDDCEDGVGIA